MAINKAQETEANTNATELIEVPLGSDGVIVHVKPAKQWRSSAIHALRSGDIEVFASTSLTPESYEIWQEIDPDLTEIEQFFSDWSEASGSDLNLSKAPKRSSKRTQTR